MTPTQGNTPSPLGLSFKESSGVMLFSAKKFVPRQDKNQARRLTCIYSVFGHSRAVLLGLNQNSSKHSRSKIVRFSENEVEVDNLDNSQMLQLHQRIMDGKHRA